MTWGLWPGAAGRCGGPGAFGPEGARAVAASTGAGAPHRGGRHGSFRHLRRPARLRRPVTALPTTEGIRLPNKFALGITKIRDNARAAMAQVAVGN
jgi:hypothetical protein